jgi:chorismate dehydratase
MATAAQSRHTDPIPAGSRPTRVGVVSFVNTLPLIDGLERLAGLETCHSVPSLLVDMLIRREVDLALCSSIDYQLAPDPLIVVPAGALACRGPTLTVRLFSQRPIEQLDRVYCDTDSHTSVVLMQILLREHFDVDPQLIPYDAREHVAENQPLQWPEAVLLIGDKVVTDSPPAVRYPTQVDLGDLWHRHTSTPFVFAVWMARRDGDRERAVAVGRILDHQRRHNRLRLDRIIHDRVRPRQWPLDLARTYLAQRLVYDFDARHLAAMELFHRKAYEHGLIKELREVEVVDLGEGTEARRGSAGQDAKELPRSRHEGTK